MNQSIAERVSEIAAYIDRTHATVRAAAAEFGISKSTVHKDCSERLREVDPDLYARVRKILDDNLSERHIRGGDATRKTYAAIPLPPPVCTGAGIYPSV